MMQDVAARAAKIRLVIFDVDGVLTDGKLVFDDQGREYKSFHCRDGHGLKMLRQTGIEVAVISGRASPAVAARMANLGIQHLFQGQQDKLAAFAALCERLQLAPEQIAYVGDDLPDLPIMQRVGLAIAVSDAHFSVRERAHWCTAHAGGTGAAREVCDLIMEAQGSLDSLIAAYF